MDTEELIRQIIGAAIAVHKDLGPGYLESVYETALTVELDRMGLRYERQKVVPIRFRDIIVGEHRLNLVVEGKVIVENKAVLSLDKIFFVIVRSYLKAANLKDALLLNFAAMPLTIKRVGSEDTQRYLAHD